MKTYLTAMGMPLVCASIFSITLTYLVMAANDRWLAYWISAAQKADDEGTELNTSLYAGVYAALSFGFLCMMIFSSALFNEGAAKAGRSMHRDCLMRLMHAPMEWFEANPSGRVLSRFSTDISWVDLRLCEITDTFLQFTVSAVDLRPSIISLTLSCFISLRSSLCVSSFASLYLQSPRHLSSALPPSCSSM
jgi:ABC-type multidrug transport system fused ATPase/permease subunit